MNQVGFPAEDIIFDPNIFPVATGMEEHKLNALDFFRTTKWIRENLPYAHVSGGVSNVSFLSVATIKCVKPCIPYSLSCHSKRNDDGNCESRNVRDL